MKKQSREVTVGIGLVVMSLATGILFATSVYKTNTFKNVNEVQQKEQSYTIKTVAKEYVPDKLVFVNIQPKEEVKEEIKTEIVAMAEEQQEIAEIKQEETVTEEVKEEEKEEVKDPIVYDGLTMTELTEKLNRNMKSNISGMGNIYASYALEIGIDPYLALAITLHETGCNGTSGCSKLLRECNNVGGQKGSPSCNGGSYKKYDTLEDGIKGYMDNIKKNYYDYGLTTPETMNKKYAADPNWSTKVNKYIDNIKAN